MNRTALTASALILYLGLCMLIPSSLFAEGNDHSNDGYSAHVEHRKFDTETLHELRSDADFKYELPPEAKPNLLQIIFQKIFKWLVSALGNEVLAWLILAVVAVIGAVGLGFAIYGIFGVGKTVPIYMKDNEGLDYQVKEENIHDISFADEIEAAIQQGDYRKAIRLMYLLALKMLTDREIITWAPHKTNHDYLSEINTTSFREQLSTLGYYFEYAWYGHFQVKEEHLNEMKNAFSGLEDELRNG